MIKSNVTKFLISTVGLTALSGALSGCGLASLPGGYSPIEQQTLQELHTSNYTPRSADERAAILTQDLFAQTAFWSREFDLNPADLEAAINLASTLRRLGNPHKSIEVAQTTRALYPRDVDLMTELAAALIADNNPKDALPVIDSALAQRPNMARLWSLKGAALDQFEQFTEARQQYSRGLAIAPNNPGIIANVGLSYALEGDPKTAEIWLRRAANMPGASPSVRQNLSLVLGLQNKFDEAEKWAGRDLNEQSIANNMSYIRTLRGSSSPVVDTQKPVGTPAYNTPQPAPQKYVPKTYGQTTYPVPVQPSVRPTPTASYQRLPALPKTQIPQAYGETYNRSAYNTPAKISTPVPSLAQYGQPQSPRTKLTMISDLSKNDSGPKTAREAALAMARQSSTFKTTNPTIRMQTPTRAQPQTSPTLANGNVPPQDLLGRISRNNIPKTAIAQRQQQQLAYRAQMQRQVQMGAQTYMPNGQPTPAYSTAYDAPAPDPNAAPNAAQPQASQVQPVYGPAPVYGSAYGQPPLPQVPQVRQPARQRR